VKAGRAVSHVVLIAGAVVMLLPFVWMLSTSVKPADQLFTVPPTWLPRPIQWDNYVKAMGAGSFGRYAMNSLMLVTPRPASKSISPSTASERLLIMAWKP